MPCITFDQKASPQSTLMTVDAPDRLGLLQDILLAVANCGLNVEQACIETRRRMARDRIFIHGPEGGKILETARLEELEMSLRAVLTAKD